MTILDTIGHNSIRVKPVILCGGGGSRLWPMSTQDRPKPFIPLIDQKSLFQQTLDRCSKPRLFQPPMIVTGSNHLDLVLDQISSHRDVEIIAEPCPKNTAAAIALAAFALNEDDIFLLCPSDHYIIDTKAFHRAVRSAAELAAKDHLVAIAITPDHPHTGYGYIEMGECVGPQQYKIQSFVEKPDFATAESFLNSGKHYWNGGIYCFKVGLFKSELKKFRPLLYNQALDSLFKADRIGGIIYPDAGIFSAIQPESIDYALMEQTARSAAVFADMGWSDVGDWNALCDNLPMDFEGNFANYKSDIVDCQNFRVFSDKKRVSAIGCKDLIVVVQGDEVLILNPKDAQRVKDLMGVKAQ